MIPSKVPLTLILNYYSEVCLVWQRNNGHIFICFLRCYMGESALVFQPISTNKKALFMIINQ